VKTPHDLSLLTKLAISALANANLENRRLTQEFFATGGKSP
jgi:hypothetical protein